MTLFVISDSNENARAWMKMRELQPIGVVVLLDAKKAGSIQFTANDRVAYVGQFWLNPDLGEIQHRLGNVRDEQIEGIADNERGDLIRILGLTSNAPNHNDTPERTDQ